MGYSKRARPVLNKYHAIAENGSASRKEARRKWELELEQRAGAISGLRYQVPFELISEKREPDTIGPRGGIRRGKVIERNCEYIADFVYYRDGELVVEDAKGYKGGEAYKLFVIKRKLMLDRHGIRIKEV